MNNNLFIGDILIQNDSRAMSGANDFIITDLHNVKQVTLSKSAIGSTIEFMIQNMGAYGEDAKIIKTIESIENECKIRKVLLLKKKLDILIGKLDIFLDDKRQQEFWNIKDNPQNSEIYLNIFTLFSSIKQQLKNIKLSDEQEKELINKGIHMNTFLTFTIIQNSNKYKAPYIIDGCSIKNLKFKNNTDERNEYLIETQFF